MTRKVLFILLGVIAIVLIAIFGFLFYFGNNFGKNHRRNYFVEGEFTGVNEVDSEQIFTFTVKLITKEKFDNSDGINVVHDIYKNQYYSLVLYYEISGNIKREYITFKNLVAYGTPITYKDDYLNYITPFNKANKPEGHYEYDYSMELNYKNEKEDYISVDFKRK